MQAYHKLGQRIAMRSPETVMRLERMGSFHQCRLSFMRTLLRRMTQEQWSFDRPLFEFDCNGVGRAIYAARGPQRSYSLVCFGHDLPAEHRSDRVIAHAWDSTFALFDGSPTERDIERLARNVSKQEAGRVSSREIILSRANRSVRLFNHVVQSLAAGQQPDIEQIKAVGYIMRTTAVYGSGKFGAIDREATADRRELAGPFQAEMLAVYLIRAYTLDLVEHLARTRSPTSAVRMDPALRRRFGVGNSTGLGLAPFLVNHPLLIHNWIEAREKALARVRSRSRATKKQIACFRSMLARASVNVEHWRSRHPVQLDKLATLKSDLAALGGYASSCRMDNDLPWNRLFEWGKKALSIEGQEQLVSLLLEPHPELVDNLVEQMGADEAAVFRIDGSMSLDRLRTIVEDVYGWALEIDWDARESIARAWYISEEKLEPRLGERFEEFLDPYEQPMSPGRDAAAMFGDIKKWTGAATVAAFLLQHPEHRHIARRAQLVAIFPYAEIRDNTISARMMPIDLLRCKLSFFGATHFDPRSDRWVRINMFQNAPFPHELSLDNADDWSYPRCQEASG